MCHVWRLLKSLPELPGGHMARQQRHRGGTFILPMPMSTAGAIRTNTPKSWTCHSARQADRKSPPGLRSPCPSV